MSLKVALLQLSAECLDLEANLAKGEAFCRQAKLLGADIALFPEMWSTGYLCFNFTDPVLQDVWKALAIDQSSVFFKRFQALAQELGLAIGFTYLESWAERPRDTVSLIDRHGQVALTYAKTHLCGFEQDLLTAGEDFPICLLDTAAGQVNIGMMICFDCFFPEVSRILAIKGAEIILSPNSDGLTSDKLALFRTRAYENTIGFATANYWYADPREANGYSCAFDGIAFDQQGQQREMMVGQGDKGEQIVTAAFDVEEMRRYRKAVSFVPLRQPAIYSQTLR